MIRQPVENHFRRLLKALCKPVYSIHRDQCFVRRLKRAGDPIDDRFEHDRRGWHARAGTF